MSAWDEDSPLHPYHGIMGVCLSCGYPSQDWRHGVTDEWFNRQGWTWDGEGWNP